jgi:large subunit ribosomal protein L23
MDLTIYDIIQGPIISDKAYKLNKALKKLVLKVHPAANKPLVAEAIEKLFNVKVKDVRILVRKGKNRTVKRRVVQGGSEKRAIVTLVEGYSLDMFDQSGNQAVAETSTK